MCGSLSLLVEGTAASLLGVSSCKGASPLSTEAVWSVYVANCWRVSVGLVCGSHSLLVDYILLFTDALLFCGQLS